MSYVMRRPWIGDRFGGLLIIGESHYGDTDDVALTETIVGEVVSGQWTHRFFTAVEQVVTGKAAYGRGQDSFWHTVAFANFCPGGVDGPRHRPSLRMWEAGHAFLPDLIATVRPRRILVLGNETWDNFPSIKDVQSVESPTGRRRDLARLTAETGVAADGVPITSIRHPAAVGFSAKAWHPYFENFVRSMPEKGA